MRLGRVYDSSFANQTVMLEFLNSLMCTFVLFRRSSQASKHKKQLMDFIMLRIWKMTIPFQQHKYYVKNKNAKRILSAFDIMLPEPSSFISYQSIQNIWCYRKIFWFLFGVLCFKYPLCWFFWNIIFYVCVSPCISFHIKLHYAHDFSTLSYSQYLAAYSFFKYNPFQNKNVFLFFLFFF